MSGQNISVSSWDVNGGANGAVGSAGGWLMLAQDDAPPTALVGGGGTDGAGDETSTTGAPGGAVDPGARPQTAPMGNPFIWMLPLIVVFVFMIWSSSSAQRKERKKRDSMLSTLRRHDRVQTIGGIIGAIVEVKDNEVVLKVDEANNIKMRFAKSSVQQVLSESGETEGQAAG